MIRSFADDRTAALYRGLITKGTPPDLARRAQRKLVQIDTVKRVEDLRFPPGNALEQLQGDRAGRWSIRVNDQWRIVFIWRDGDAWEVWFGDYH